VSRARERSPHHQLAGHWLGPHATGVAAARLALDPPALRDSRLADRGRDKRREVPLLKQVAVSAQDRLAFRRELLKGPDHAALLPCRLWDRQTPSISCEGAPTCGTSPP
jgi:hypothetical protein